MTITGWLGEAKKDIYGHLCFDFYVALGFLFASPHRFSALSFNPAKAVADSFGIPLGPMRLWGAVLMVISILTLVAVLTRSQVLWEMSRNLVMAFWIFWAGLFVTSVINGDGWVSGGWGVLWAFRTTRLMKQNPWRKFRVRT